MNYQRRLRAHIPRLACMAMAVGTLLVIPGKGYVEEPTNSEPSSQSRDSGEQDASNDADSDADFHPPKLLYLAWQEDGIESTGEPIEHILWDAEGQIVDLQEGREILQKVKSFDVHWRDESSLHPLVLVFSVDEELKAPAPVAVSIIAPDGRRHATGTAKVQPSGGMILSAFAPEKRALGRWPSQLSLEITYPLENLTTIRTVTKMSQEPIEVDPGVTLYVDESRAVERSEATGEMVRAEGKVAAVLQKRREPEVLATYGARVYLRGREEPLDYVYSTLTEPDGILHEIDVSEPFGGKEEIERIELVRQRRARRLLENVPLHPELLQPNGR